MQLSQTLNIKARGSSTLMFIENLAVCYVMYSVSTYNMRSFHIINSINHYY